MRSGQRLRLAAGRGDLSTQAPTFTVIAFLKPAVAQPGARGDGLSRLSARLKGRSPLGQRVGSGARVALSRTRYQRSMDVTTEEAYSH